MKGFLNKKLKSIIEVLSLNYKGQNVLHASSTVFSFMRFLKNPKTQHRKQNSLPSHNSLKSKRNINTFKEANSKKPRHGLQPPELATASLGLQSSLHKQMKRTTALPLSSEDGFHAVC